MRKVVACLICICFYGLSLGQTEAPLYEEYFEGQLIVKIKPELADKCNKSSIELSSIQQLFDEGTLKKTSKIFPKHKTIKNKSAENKLVDLSTIYRFEFDETIDEKKLLRQLKRDKNVVYAELNYKNYLTYSPSDSLNDQQWYLDAVNAYAAWDVQKGDTSVVIAFTDTGSDMDHEDLIDDYAYNYDDPINGIDDDNDGYIDNYNGWDVANNDNDPQLTNLGHGVNVAGIASASTDNGKGISGAGFNTKLLTIKIDDATTGQLTGAYEGIIYAADHGAFIISNSWGSFFYSEFAQDIINYAAINKGALVIAATGNNGLDRRFYPAAYENVLSVGSMTFNDIVKDNSNYGYWTNIFAPGDDMLTTNAIGEYNMNGGTSMAAPLVAGIASLVKSQFPQYSAKQVMEQIINTGDNVETINDSKYAGKIGSGQINAFRALTDTFSPGISLVNRKLSDHNDEVFLPGDTIRLSGDFKNFLKDAKNVSVSIRTIDDKLQVLSNSRLLGDIDNFDSVSVSPPFLMKINPGIGFNEVIEVEVDISADNYNKKEYFIFTVNADFITVNENNLTVTLSSDGGIGFSGLTFNMGEGIKYLNGNSLLYNGSFIIGNSENYVANKFRGTPDIDNHFEIVEPIRSLTPRVAKYEASTTFNDGKLRSSPSLEITQKNFVFDAGGAENSIIYEFAIKNISGSTIENLHGGLLMDWDIENFAKNKITYDATRKMGVSFATDTAIFCGIKVLNDSLGSFHYGIDNAQAGNGGINITDNFTDAEKFQSISSFRNQAGETSSDGNDIVDVNAIGPFNLDNGETKFISFAITVSNDLSALKAEADIMQDLFDRFILGLQGVPAVRANNGASFYPNPANDELTVDLRLVKQDNIDIEIYDGTGKKVLSRLDHVYPSGTHKVRFNLESLKTGVYLLKIDGGNLLFQDKFVVAK